MRPSKLACNYEGIDDPARFVLETALEQLGVSAEDVSLAIEMPPTYLRGYLEHGAPRALPNRIRRRLAAYLGVPDYALA